MNFPAHRIDLRNSNHKGVMKIIYYIVIKYGPDYIFDHDI